MQQRDEALGVLPPKKDEVEPFLNALHLNWRGATELRLPTKHLLLHGEEGARVLGTLADLHLGLPRVLCGQLVALVAVAEAREKRRQARDEWVCGHGKD